MSIEHPGVQSQLKINLNVQPEKFEKVVVPRLALLKAVISLENFRFVLVGSLWHVPRIGRTRLDSGTVPHLHLRLRLLMEAFLLQLYLAVPFQLHFGLCFVLKLSEVAKRFLQSYNYNNYIIYNIASVFQYVLKLSGVSKCFCGVCTCLADMLAVRHKVLCVAIGKKIFRTPMYLISSCGVLHCRGPVNPHTFGPLPAIRAGQRYVDLALCRLPSMRCGLNRGPQAWFVDRSSVHGEHHRDTLLINF